jgi:quercetin dioxygenase-like cupin family protein
MSKLKSQKVKNPQEYPWIITDLPEAEVQVEGVKAWILQGEKHQLVFFEMQPHASVPEHSHDYPQWGMLLEGKMRLTIDGKTHVIDKGDEYVIPAKARHYATFSTKSRAMDFFSEKARYKAKST